MSLFLPRVQEILEAMKNKVEMRLVRLGMFYLVFLVVLLVVLMVPLMFQSSKFGLFKVATKFLTEGPKNATINSFGSGRGLQNITHDNSGGRTIFKRSKFVPLTSSTNDLRHDKDKLLDGLLVSGFDKASCISRQQSLIYRKVSPHKPSPYLISKLRNYEKIHRKCGPNSRAYNRDMRKIAESKNNSATTTLCNYILWSPTDGLGNQLLSMASTFLYALLTNRVFIVKFGKDKHDLFCEPFLNSTWLLPETTNFKNVTSFQNIIDGDFTLPTISTLLVDLKFHPSYPERFFHCDHSQDLLSKVPVLILESNQYFAPSLFMTPVFINELNKMFPNIDTVFHHLGRYLFHPSNEAWGLISNFYQAHLAEADEKLGIQIRVYEAISIPQKIFMNQILNCTIQNKLLPQVGMPLQSSVSSSGNNQSVKTVLVASLSAKYGEDLRAMYMNKPTVTGEVIKVYQPSGEGHQKFDDNEHNMKAWVEMYLLSLSDVLVTTYHSTFGYVAKGLGNSKRWILYRPINDVRVPFPTCEREFLLEPCYHARPSHYCDGKLMYDQFTSSFPYINSCRDYPSGFKLINGSNSIYM